MLAQGAPANKESFPGETARWRRYQSPNFELFSAARDAESRQLLHHLELLRALFFETFKVKERQPLPVSVYYFSEAKDFKAYAPALQRQALGGYYLDQPDRAVMAFSPVWDTEWERHIVFHEYIHHLNRVIGAVPPLWYNEGTAELFSTIEFKPDGVILGKHLPWYVESLRDKGLLPLETLFSIGPDSPTYNNKKHSGQFYAESWALLHYLRYGENNLDQDKIEQLLTYFLNEPAETDPVSRRKVFRETLGIDYLEMHQRLDAYLRKGTFYRYKAKLPLIPEMKSYESREMSTDEMRLFLAELSLRVNQSATARFHLLQRADQVAGSARCWEALGSDAWNGGDPGEAEERWRRAMVSGSNNPAIFRELGQLEGWRWFERFDYNFRMPEVQAQALRALLKRSLEYAPDQNDGYELLAWVEASAIKPEIANLDLVQRRFRATQPNARTLLALVLVRVRLGDQSAAMALLDQLDQMHPEYWVVSAAEIVRAKLEGRAPRPIAPPVASPAAARGIRMRLPELPR